MVLRTFDVFYNISEDGDQRVVEKAIKSDRIRLVVTNEQTYSIASKAAKVIPTKPVINAATGLGGWQTVALREVDEEKERQEHEKAVEDMFKAPNEPVPLPII